MDQPIIIGGQSTPPGEELRLEIPFARLPIHTMLNLPVSVINGVGPGPCIWLSAALHGDELNGMEIIRRVLDGIRAADISGAIIAVPIVNVFGFVHQSRYMPDRRDLNRSFPGSKRGSLASQLAHLFMTEIVSRCTHGIDLHTAAPPRTNLPQVRGDLRDEETRRCALAFGAPVMMDSTAPRGAMRGAVARRKIPMILYESGEPHRFNEDAIQMGVAGVQRVLNCLGITQGEVPPAPRSLEPQAHRWVRAGQSGVFYLDVGLGDWVTGRQKIGTITDPFGDSSVSVRAPFDGIVIGHTNQPLVHRGDGIVHVARSDEG